MFLYSPVSRMWGRLLACAPIVNRRWRGECRAHIRLVLAVLFTCGSISPQIAPPHLGFVRDRDGRVRVLRGVSGNFTVGEPVLEGANECWFDGRRGVARTGDAVVSLNAAGETTGKAARMPAVSVARIEGDDVVIAATGVRLRMTSIPDRIERAGADYIVVTSGASRLLVRFTRGKEQIFELPEPAE